MIAEQVKPPILSVWLPIGYPKKVCVDLRFIYLRLVISIISRDFRDKGIEFDFRIPCIRASCFNA